MNTRIQGFSEKLLTIELNPQESFYAEPGAMVYCSEGITRKLIKQRNRWSALFSGESIFLCHYFNPTDVPLTLMLSGTAKSIFSIPLTSHDRLVVRTGAYVASNQQVRVKNQLSLKKSLAGMDTNFQQITGDATVYIDDCGNTQCKELALGETIVADEKHVRALLNIEDTQLNPEYKPSNIFSNEGISILHITGPGKVFLSTTPIEAASLRGPLGWLIGVAVGLIVFFIKILW